ncbi:RNA methyltransferase [Synergistaceae bacterium OttesenSCG-928-D05]|nr:RNA methyltransferase [Synergistaceae bacterium OttesenSCG-928-D05]
MRGIEAALKVFAEVNDGAFAAEALRKIYSDISPADRPLAATLVYCSLRRLGLWKHLLVRYSKRDVRDMSLTTQNALIVGIAGIIELKYFAMPVLVNGIVQSIKAKGDERDIGLVNAILHTVANEAPEYLVTLKKGSALRDQALFWGVPGWAAAQWSKDMTISDAKRLVRSSGMRTYLALRLSQSVDREGWLASFNKQGKKGWASDWLRQSVRTASNPYPLDLPGFGEGKITPQSESSMLVGETVAKLWKSGPILDMCCGRGIKTGQIADLLQDCEIEAWDLSQPRVRAAESEMARMKVKDRVVFKTGDALKLTPAETPELVLLDAPCSGSGTWGRHPESKWRTTPEMLEEQADLQKKLLAKAVFVVAPGGIVAYSTCSLFREENEKVVASVMAERTDLFEIPLERTHKLMQKGKPYGTVIWPGLPWVDGFYIALLAKRK